METFKVTKPQANVQFDVLQLEVKIDSNRAMYANDTCVLDFCSEQVLKLMKDKIEYLLKTKFNNEAIPLQDSKENQMPSKTKTVKKGSKKVASKKKAAKKVSKKK